MKAVAVDLGGTNIKAAVVHREKGIINQLTIPTLPQKGKDVVLDRISEAILDIAFGHRISGIGMGLPGMVNREQTTVQYPPNLTGWEVVNVSEEIQKRTQLPCKIENDANIAALGSLHFGIGRAYDDFIMLTLGTGVGGGIIINKSLYKGSRGMAGELGHVIINFNGPSSNSVTRGTAEAYLGQRFMSRLAVEEISKHPGNSLYKQFFGTDQTLEPKHLAEEADRGNELAKEILRKSGEKLGLAIVNYMHVLDIPTVIVSGGVAKAGRFLLNSAQSTALEQLMPPFRENFSLLTEDLGNNGALLGAGGLVFDSFS